MSDDIDQNIFDIYIYIFFFYGKIENFIITRKNSVHLESHPTQSMKDFPLSKLKNYPKHLHSWHIVPGYLFDI